MALPQDVDDLDNELKKLHEVPEEVNAIAVEELRRSYDSLNRSVDKLQVKTLTFLAATFTLLTYLYNDGSLFIPPQVYGKIFYFVGISFTLGAAILFLFTLRPAIYVLPTAIAKLKGIQEKTKSQYLEYVKNEYISSFGHNIDIYEKKHRDFNLGFILLIIGASMLVILKTFPDSSMTCYNKTVVSCNTIQQPKGAAK